MAKIPVPLPWADAFLYILDHPLPGDELCAYLNSGLPAPRFLNLADSIPAGPSKWHSGSILKHMARCMNEVAGDRVAVWLVLCHDSGKLTTPKSMLPHHYGHELRGQEMSFLWGQQLGLNKDLVDAAVMTSRLHMKAGKFFLLRPGKKLSLLEEVFATPYAPAFWKVVDADTKAGISHIIMQQWAILSHAELDGIDRDHRILLVKHLNNNLY